MIDGILLRYAHLNYAHPVASVAKLFPISLGIAIVIGTIDGFFIHQKCKIGKGELASFLNYFIGIAHIHTAKIAVFSLAINEIEILSVHNGAIGGKIGDVHIYFVSNVIKMQGLIIGIILKNHPVCANEIGI